MTKETCARCKWGGLLVAAASLVGLYGTGIDPFGLTQLLLLSGTVVGTTASISGFQIDRARQATWH